MVILDVKQGEDWTGRRSLGTNRRQRSKKFLIVMIESRLEAERPESFLGPMLELAEIVL